MTKKIIHSNAGIILGDGSNLSATNVAVGDNATINSTVGKQFNITSEIANLRKIFSESDLESGQQETALGAVETIEVETEKEDGGDKSAIQSALAILESIGKTSSSLFPLADRVLPLLKSIYAAIF